MAMGLPNFEIYGYAVEFKASNYNKWERHHNHKVYKEEKVAIENMERTLKTKRETNEFLLSKNLEWYDESVSYEGRVLPLYKVED
jgi:hypothetical protein